MAGMNLQVNPANEINLAGYWRMNEGSGTMLTDYSTHQGHGILNAPIYSTQVPFTTPLLTASIYPPADTVVCSAQNYNLYGTTGTGFTYQWSNGSTAPNILVTNSGNYSVTITNAIGCSVTTDTVNVVVNASPPVPSITLNGQGQLVSNVINNIEWYLNGTATGQTSTIITPTQNGTYTVIATNPPNCSVSSAPYNLTNLSLSEQTSQAPLFEITPTISDGMFKINLLQNQKQTRLVLINQLGSTLLNYSMSNKEETLQLSHWPKGLYFLSIEADGVSQTQKLILQ
jgi:hypothetical protein